MKRIAVGDNVTDCYLYEGIYYPGGNAVNVAVDCKRDGAEKVNYIGVFGNDDRADYITYLMDTFLYSIEKQSAGCPPLLGPELTALCRFFFSVFLISLPIFSGLCCEAYACWMRAISPLCSANRSYMG